MRGACDENRDQGSGIRDRRCRGDFAAACAPARSRRAGRAGTGKIADSGSSSADFALAHVAAALGWLDAERGAPLVVGGGDCRRGRRRRVDSLVAAAGGADGRGCYGYSAQGGAWRIFQRWSYAHAADARQASGRNSLRSACEEACFANQREGRSAACADTASARQIDASQEGSRSDGRLRDQVVAPEFFGQGADAGNTVAADALALLGAMKNR